MCQGGVANALGQYLEAARLAQEVLSVSQEVDYPDLTARSFQVLGDATCGLGDLQKARHCSLQALETAMTVQAVRLALLTLVGIARPVLTSRWLRPEKCHLLVGPGKSGHRFAVHSAERCLPRFDKMALLW